MGDECNRGLNERAIYKGVTFYFLSWLFRMRMRVLMGVQEHFRFIVVHDKAALASHGCSGRGCFLV